MLELLCGKTNDTRMGSYRGQGLSETKTEKYHLIFYQILS